MHYLSTRHGGILGPEEEKERYRDAGRNPALSNFLSITMRRGLIDKIFRGDLSCLGVEVSPKLGNSPELLQRYLFTNPDIDWEKSTMRAFGRIYEGVRVVSPQDTIDVKLPEAARPKPLGRPSVGRQIRQIVRELADAGQLEGISRKEQETRIRSRARELYPHSFPRPSQPSRTKILEALKAEGL